MIVYLWKTVTTKSATGISMGWRKDTSSKGRGSVAFFVSGSHHFAQYNELHCFLESPPKCHIMVPEFKEEDFGEGLPSSAQRTPEGTVHYQNPLEVVSDWQRPVQLRCCHAFILNFQSCLNSVFSNAAFQKTKTKNQNKTKTKKPNSKKPHYLFWFNSIG